MLQRDIPTCSEINSNGGHAQGTEIHTSGVQASAKSWASQIRSTLHSPSKMWGVSKNVCIYRVPKPLMISNKKAYVPFVVSFGPYHHKNNSELSTMDHYKLEAVHRMLARLNIDVTILIAEIHMLESEIRECYDEPIDLDGESLSLMLAMDACFILELLREKCHSDCKGLVSNSMFNAILNDMIKLENQIPLFILIEVLQLEYKTREKATEVLAGMLSTQIVFSGFPFQVSWVHDSHRKLKQMIEERHPYHLLDLCRMASISLLTKSQELVIRNEQEWSMNVELPGWMQRRSTPSAELLDKAGIKFQLGQLSFEKRRFGATTLSLPRIIIMDITDLMLRNLMAYEECKTSSWSSNDTIISHFVILLADLIDSEKDVSVLRNSLVIESWVSDEDIVRMFNRLVDGITFSGNEEIDFVMKQAREHCNSQWRVWCSQLKKDIFSGPWYILSVLTGILMMVMSAVYTVLTVIQTVYTVKNYN